MSMLSRLFTIWWWWWWWSRNLD